MKNDVYKKTINSIHKSIVSDARRNGWMWFYNLHLKEVFRAAKELLTMYEADEQIVLIACWLHDVSKLKTAKKEEADLKHATHHIDSYNVSREILDKFNINTTTKEAILNCVLRHRNIPEYEPQSIEEKIVAVADVVSHFTGAFYFTHFNFHPDDTIADMSKKQYYRIEKDWNDLDLLPKSKKMVKDNYLFLKELCGKYVNNI